MSRVYTRTGDDGTTSLLFGGRTSKGASLIDAVGDIDETVSAIGVARAKCVDSPTGEILFSIQRDLFVVAADLASNPLHRDRLKSGVSLVETAMVDSLEARIDELVATQPLRPVFIVPGTNSHEASLDLARTVARRAERHAVQAREAGHPISDDAMHYLNRVSDLLYVLARHAVAGSDEPASHD